MKFVVKFSRLPIEISRAPITGSYWGKKRDKIIALQEYNAKARAALSWKFELEFDGARWISALGLFTPSPSPLIVASLFHAAKIDRPAFLRPFYFARPMLRLRMRPRRGKEARGMERSGERTIGYTYPRFARRDQPGNKLAREKAKRRRGSESGGGKTDVAGANRLNIFQPGRNGGLELAMSGKSRTPTCSLRFWFRIITRNRRVCFPIPSNNREILVRVYQREDNLITRVSHRFSISRDTYTVLERSLMY